MSLLFAQNKTAVATVILASEGTPITGLVDADIKCYIAKNGVFPPIEYDLTGKVVELSASVMAGLYAITFTGTTVLDTEGEIIIHVFEAAGIDPADSFDSYLLKGLVYTKDLSDLDVLGTDTNTTLKDVEIIVGAVENTVDTSIVPSLSTIDGKSDTIISDVDTRATTLDLSVADLDSDLAIVDTKADQIILDIDTRADTLDSSISNVGSTVNSNTAALTGLEDSFDGYVINFNTRVPENEVVATRSLLVNGTGNVNPPQNKGIWDALGDGETSISDLGLDVKRMLGLSQENYKITGHVYDANNNLVSAEVKTYPTSTDLGNSTNELATYEMTASYDGQNRLASYEVILIED